MVNAAEGLSPGLDPPEKEKTYGEPSDADRVRELLTRLGLGQRAAARELDIAERTMRGYCGGARVPRIVILALERLIDLQRVVGGDSAGK